MRLPRLNEIVLLMAFALTASVAGTARPLNAQSSGEVRLHGRVSDVATGQPLSYAVIEFGEPRRRVLTDSVGQFSVAGLGVGTVVISAWKFNYSRADTTVLLRSGDNRIDIPLRVRPIALLPLTVTAERESGGTTVERALFDREAVPGVVGISAREIRNVPILAEADVLRSLQAVPGVVMLNDLSAQLHVRGGGPDQNLFLLDGARIFAPYHLFGMFGVFNTDAVERVEFFRGAIPARYGGALSSVIEVEQRDGSTIGVKVDGGLSLLGTRLAARGAFPLANAQWLVAGRRSHVEGMEAVRGGDLPYSFHDLQTRFTFDLSPRHRIQASFFESSDWFRMLFGAGDFGKNDEDLESRWRNTAGSVQWRYSGTSWSANYTLWGSGYAADLFVGDGPQAPPTSNRVEVGGVRAEISRRGQNSGFRAGMDVESRSVVLAGSDQVGSYFSGEIQKRDIVPAVYAEVDQWFGPGRLMSGARVLYDARSGHLLLEPRIGGRLHFNENTALTLGAGRTHQTLSALRDDRLVLPGPPFWFIHPEERPASRTDGVSAALDSWIASIYHFTLGAYARRFSDVPSWTPVGARDLSGLTFDNGRALGVEMSVRKHAGRLTGWFGYGFGKARLTHGDTGSEYLPAWDRLHAVDGALFFRLWSRLSLSSRITYGGGLPFWPFAGYHTSVRLSPLAGRTDFRGDAFPLWAETQSRYPDYFRLDMGARYPFRLWGAELEPYLSVQNITTRPNVLYYQLRSDGGEPSLIPVIPFPFTAIPSVGFDVRF